MSALREHRDLVHGYRLKIAAVLARGFKPRRLEADGNIVGGALVSSRPGVAAFHGIVGQHLRRMPPGERVRIVNLTIAQMLLRARTVGCAQCQREEQNAEQAVRLWMGVHG